MPSVQNIGPVDYQQMPVQNQLPEMEEYTAEPQVYDAEIEEKKSASGMMKGLTALGVIAGAGGLIYGIKSGKAVSNYKKQVSALQEEVAKLKQTAADEKGFKPYMKRTITGSWLFKTVWTWPKKGIMKLVDLVKGKKDSPKV